ncbi:hypothetical protein [Turicibacter sanguinis]|uniref:hypothetical protein n=1 Tax=Turicibacter sanguinis TaxID=154288 RepID=UPI0002F439F2|nr:hypothetical protein [Turicibacter sanguinis]
MQNEAVVTVNNLNMYFYTNQRCNKVINGVSFEIKKEKHYVLLENQDVEKV